MANDERGMASAFALAAVLLLLSGTAALLVLSGHNRLAAKEAVETTRLVEGARSAVRLGAARLERDEVLRRQLEQGGAEEEVAGGCFSGSGGSYRTTAKRLPEADTKEGAAYRLTAVSWQEAEDDGPAAEPSGKRAYAAAVYRYGEGRLAFVHWEK